MPDKESRLLDQKILRFTEKYGSKPAPEIVFEWLAFEIFRYQYRRNAFYRKFCDFEKKTPGNVWHWKEIPGMPALAFKELVLTSFPIQKKAGVFHTSGTTGGGASATGTSADVPPRGAHFFDTFSLYEASILPTFLKFLIPETYALRECMTGSCTPEVHWPVFGYYFLMSSPKRMPHSSLSYMMGVLNRRLAGNRGKFYVKNGAPQFKKLVSDLNKENKKVILFSTAFALKGFLDYLSSNKMKIRLPPGSRLMETGGFKGRVREISKNALYAQCAKRLGLPKTHCVSEYGMTELSSQTYDSALIDYCHRKKRKPVKMGPSWLKTLVMDPSTGHEAKKGFVGLLRFVDLANRGSVMAVQTEDLGRAVGEGFEFLGRAKGAELRGCSLTYEEFLRKAD